MALLRWGDKPLFEPMMVSLLRHICIPLPQWVNSLWARRIICQHRTGSTLAQVMACCLMAPSHYLNQYRLIVIGVNWQSHGQFHKEIPQPWDTNCCLKIAYLEFHANLPEANELTQTVCLSLVMRQCQKFLFSSLQSWAALPLVKGKDHFVCVCAQPVRDGVTL